MKFLAVIVLAAVPLLIFGMVFHAARVFSLGEIRVIDIFGFVLQILLVFLSIFVGMVLWKRRDGGEHR